MQITYKRNGLKSYMIVKTEKVDSGSLREKMVVRNNIDYLARVNPQRIDGHICFYYDNIIFIITAIYLKIRIFILT